MIAFIKGKLLEKDPSGLLIDVNGMGYEVFVPMTTFYALGDQDSEISLYTHFIVREDVQQLYGFKSKVDKKVFQALIKVNGVGAKIALAILSGVDCKTLLHCVENKDYGLLSTVPGIGKKTAERLVVEMSDKLMKLSGEIHGQGDDTTGTYIPNTADTQSATASIFNESVDGLMALGYKQRDAEKMIRSTIKDSKNSSEAIKNALRGSIKSK